MMKIIQADTASRVADAKALFLEYARSLDFDLCFQHFDREMDNFPGEYTPPDGALLLAVLKDDAIGCVGLRPIEGGICEMKRLYVREQARGLTAGYKLVKAIIDKAIQLGYTAIRLDTLPSMQQANRLYQAFGFKKIPPYRHNPIKGAIYLELKLH